VTHAARTLVEEEGGGVGVQLGQDAETGSLFFSALVLEGHALLLIVHSVIRPSKVFSRGYWQPLLLVRVVLNHKKQPLRLQTIAPGMLRLQMGSSGGWAA
jgi:hypothetical protein